MSNKKTILIADSCGGGLGVLYYILSWCGNYNVIYLSDSKYNPFGLKSKNQIIEIVTSWYAIPSKLGLDIDLLVIACNTASIAIHSKTNYFDSVSRVKKIDMVDGFHKMATYNTKHLNNRAVTIMATKFTIESNAYQSIISPYSPTMITEIVATQCAETVTHALYLKDEGIKKIHEELSSFSKTSHDTVILSCTCFEFITSQIQSTLGTTITFLNPAQYVSNQAKYVLNVQEEVIKAPNDVMYIDTGSDYTANSLTLLIKEVFNITAKVDLKYFYRNIN